MVGPHQFVRMTAVLLTRLFRCGGKMSSWSSV